jgi:hypothetical protein
MSLISHSAIQSTIRISFATTYALTRVEHHSVPTLVSYLPAVSYFVSPIQSTIRISFAKNYALTTVEDHFIGTDNTQELLPYIGILSMTLG